MKGCPGYSQICATKMLQIRVVKIVDTDGNATEWSTNGHVLIHALETTRRTTRTTRRTRTTKTTRTTGDADEYGGGDDDGGGDEGDGDDDADDGDDRNDTAEDE